jgi:tetratricopeptide (TPR) repeat protein
MKVSRRRPTAAALALLVTLAGCATTPSSHVEDTKEMRALQARSAYERGTTALSQQQAGLALASFQEAVQLDPGVAVYADAMGTVLLQMRQLQASLAWLDRAVELDPTFGDAHFHRGTALAETGRFEEAVGAYRRALTLPTLTVPDAAHHNLGYALFALKRYREAEASLRFALSIATQDAVQDERQKQALARTHLNLGLVLAAEGRTEEAKAQLRHARALAPDSPSARDAAEQLKALGEGG